MGAINGLTSYLDAGGSLLMSGQLIGYYSFSGGAPLEGQVFYNAIRPAMRPHARWSVRIQLQFLFGS